MEQVIADAVVEEFPSGAADDAECDDEHPSCADDGDTVPLQLDHASATTVRHAVPRPVGILKHEAQATDNDGESPGQDRHDDGSRLRDHRVIYSHAFKRYVEVDVGEQGVGHVIEYRCICAGHDSYAFLDAAYLRRCADSTDQHGQSSDQDRHELTG